MVAPEMESPSEPEESQPSTMPRSLIELGLRGPTLGTLQRQGILSIVQLMSMSPDELMSMRRVGLSRMLEIRQALQSHGLDLRVEGPSLPVRTWEHARRVRLTCCDSGECILDLKTAGASKAELARMSELFVVAHRGCSRLGGRQPVFSVTEHFRPGPGRATVQLEPDDEERADVRSA